MDDHVQSFLDDILAHPHDDAPRLIYADWIEERGEAERAQFIRRQIHNARESAWRGVERVRLSRWRVEFRDIVAVEPWKRYGRAGPRRSGESLFCGQAPATWVAG